jgi:hypothetical protein
MAENPGSITFEYEKSNQFRALIMAGATVLGFTPSGVSIAFYTEHPPLPTAVVHHRLPDGNLPEQPDQVDIKQGTVIRETEFVMTMDFEAVKDFARILQQSIEQVEAQLSYATVVEAVKQ